MKNDIFPVVAQGCCMNWRGCRKNGNKKLGSFDWLCDMPETQKDTDYIEVQFKNTRKSYFLNSTHIPLQKGDIVAVESSSGHDIGEVTMTGRLVLLQMAKNNFNPEKMEVRRVYRKARENDIVKFNEAKAKEQQTMIDARKIAEDLKLNMKIGDVEFQGDGSKAIFYYIADERVDFRRLIKVFAETFHVRIEMKQIGARQEAGRIGGIGYCGRQLCCSSWITGFNSVSTVAARYQDISLNPQKLAGQCSKLKCCMNYELDTYIEALKDIPSHEIALETLDNTYFHFKTDVFKRLMTYSTDKINAVNLVTIPVERVKDIITMNKNGEKPAKLSFSENLQKEQQSDYENVVGQDSLTRFDKNKNYNNKPKLIKRGEEGYENAAEQTPKHPHRKHQPAANRHRNFKLRNQNNQNEENA
jgi:cell fate regulator YaaT (PSP1 superfamily)